MRTHSPEASGDEFLGPNMPPAEVRPILSHRTEARARLIPLLASLLNDPNSIVRGEAALALGKIGAEDVMPVLRKATDDTNRFVRQLALLGIGLTKEQDAVAFLSRYILDENHQDADRSYAALGLAVLGRTEALPALAAVLHRNGVDRTLEAATVYAIGFLPGEDSILMLREYYETTGRPDDLRAAALNALAKQGEASLVPVLMKALDDPESTIRRSAALALGQIPFESPLWQRRDMLLERIRNWTGDRSVSAEAIRNLQEYVADVERKAVEETRRLQEIEKKVVAALASSVDHDRDRMVRHFAAIALGRLGSPEARLKLVEAWRKSNTNDALRSFLTIALGVGNSDEAASLLRKSLDSRLDPSTRSATLISLGLMGDMNSGTVVSDFAMKDSDPDTRSYAAISVGLMDFKPARDLMRRGLKDETHSYLRPVYGLALAMLGDYDALAMLEALAMAPEASSNTRVEATQALSTIHDLQSIAILSRLLSPSANVTDLVRATAVHAMGEVAEKSVLPGLEPLARDWNYLLPFNVINDAILR